MAARILLLAATALVLTTVPTAAAEPVCIQAYPWSEVCSVVDQPVCIQALPWSAVCDLFDAARNLLGA